jgi:2-succinyl-5-enolpyruvyl-6-hydroxy-3-cyclohexene-1-carboxylate synthase
MSNYYTDEKNVQIIISLLKKHGIKKVIASPGATNVTFVASLQNDPFFEVYSSVDERSSAYLACGLSSESGEPVVMTCTGSTASQNYFSGLIEAFYRKLPILAVTSSQPVNRVGHHVPQVTDRSIFPNDTFKLSVTLPNIKDDDDYWDCEVKVNKAVLELKRHGGGPVHINLQTTYNPSFETKDLPSIRQIHRITSQNSFPPLPEGKVAVFLGAHSTMTTKTTEIIDRFCAVNNSVVFCDHTSGYKGKYRALYALAAGQQMFDIHETKPDLLIHIGEISGDYYSLKVVGRNVWRVSEDGEIRDTFRRLTHVFEMPESIFLEHYTNGISKKPDDYYRACKDLLKKLYSKIPELPFSNIWLASKIAHLIPEGSVIHFGILNSLRSWNFFELPYSVSSASNVGGFGIDGGVSSLIGASLFDNKKLYFGVFGDLAFFYDMNVLGNRHVGKNLRILLVNNGKGTEFKLYNHLAAQHGENTDKFIAAAGHFGNMSRSLVKHYSQDLGFDYISASNKEEFEQVYNRFLSPQILDRSILFEVFTDCEEESKALETILNLEKNVTGKTKQFAKQVLGEKGISILKNAINKP